MERISEAATGARAAGSGTWSRRPRAIASRTGSPSSGEQAKQREHATPSRAPRGGTRYGGADFADIGRELILVRVDLLSR